MLHFTLREQNVLSASFIAPCQLIPFCKKNGISQKVEVAKWFLQFEKKNANDATKTIE